MRTALFPGTFDPITLGHTDIIDRSLDLFDKIIIGIGVNASKQTMFSIDQRIQWIENIYKGNDINIYLYLFVYIYLYSYKYIFIH